MSIDPEIPARISLDSSVLLGYFLGEKIRPTVRALLTGGSRKLYTSHTTIAETYYTLCRRRGATLADEVISSYLDGRYSEMVSSEELDLMAGRYKCERSISLADCYVLAAAKLRAASALFAKPEKDMQAELKAREFDVDVLFLEGTDR